MTQKLLELLFYECNFKFKNLIFYLSFNFNKLYLNISLQIIRDAY